MNAVAETVHQDPPDHAEIESYVINVAKYLPTKRPLPSHYDPAAIQRVTAHDLVRDNDKYFKRCASKFPGSEAS